MVYIPNTDADRAEMLAAIGVGSAAELFHDVPEARRFPELILPPALSEIEVLRELGALSDQNDDLNHLACFLGAGAYNHFVPTVVDFLVRRSEFFTAYTPYQPEISQGTLQAHFEYQSMICALTGMEVSNVSHYDGATAVAEAVIMALGVGRGKRNRIVLSPTLHPQYREVVHTYTQGMSLTFAGEDLPITGIADGSTDLLSALADACNSETACVVAQNPDFLGRYYTPEQMQTLADRVHGCGAMFVVSVDPISLGLFQPPGEYGADVVTGEGQPMGNGISFGGPYLGFFAMKQRDVRRSAGRIVGQTVDSEERRGFVLTLSTREQHIRRDKASSNICSNQALNALAAAVYMAAMGKHGLSTVARHSYHKAHYAAKLIGELDGYQVVDGGPFFKEFMVRCPLPVEFINQVLLDEYGILGGYDLGRDYPDLAGHLLLCVTEMNTRGDIEELAEALGDIAQLDPADYGYGEDTSHLEAAAEVTHG